MHLFLIRHGESETNANWHDELENHELNSALTELGGQQAKGAAEWLKARVPRLDALYVSTLLRTRQTASYFEEAYNIQAVPDERIREGGYSYNTAAPIEDHLLPVRKNVNFHMDPFAPFALEPSGTESYADMRQRVGMFLQEVVDQHGEIGEDGWEVGGKVVCVVIHGWTLNAFVDVIFNVPQRRSCYVNAENTAISYFEYTHAPLLGPWRIHFMNNTPHMDVFEDKFKYQGEEA